MTLGQLGQINLLLGCNDCGKSSVLDALFLISGAANPLLNIRINSLRNYDRIEPDDLLLNYYNLNSSVPINIVADMKDGFSSRELSIRPLLAQKEVVNMADMAKHLLPIKKLLQTMVLFLIIGLRQMVRKKLTSLL